MTARVAVLVVALLVLVGARPAAAQRRPPAGSDAEQVEPEGAPGTEVQPGDEDDEDDLEGGPDDEDEGDEEIPAGSASRARPRVHVLPGGRPGPAVQPTPRTVEPPPGEGDEPPAGAGTGADVPERAEPAAPAQPLGAP